MLDPAVLVLPVLGVPRKGLPLIVSRQGIIKRESDTYRWSMVVLIITIVVGAVDSIRIALRKPPVCGVYGLKLGCRIRVIRILVWVPAILELGCE